MKEYSAIVKVIANGKVTIPMQIRDLLGIDDGDLVEIKVAQTEKQIGESKGNSKALCST